MFEQSANPKILSKKEKNNLEKLNELTIKDVKQLVNGKKVEVLSKGNNTMFVSMTYAYVIAEPDIGIDGRITIHNTETGCKIEMDCNDTIECIHGNENVITITFSNGAGSLDIKISGGIDTETDYVVDQDELCQYIKDKLDRSSKLTVEDIDLVLNLEMEYLQSKGIAS